jgi:hypothetical protein
MHPAIFQDERSTLLDDYGTERFPGIRDISVLAL